MEGKEKPSYEELENQVNAQYAKLEEADKLINRMNRALMERDYQNMFKRLDYMFRILEMDKIFGEKIVKKTVAEIDAMIFPKEEEVKEEPKVEAVKTEA